MNTIHNRERAQSLVLVAIMLFVLLAMVALIIDGGMAYSQRRSAQNAADAAALAGAQEFCAGRPYTTVVQNYATLNNASWATPTPGDNDLTVVAGINYHTFLAGIIGYPTMTVQANATAGCMSPCAVTGFLPIAWSCKPTITGTIPSGYPTGCVAQTGTLNSPGPLYILLDSESIGNDCISNGGTINCNLDTTNPGDEVFTGGNRGLLNLDQTNTNCGESNIVDWIGGSNIPIPVKSFKIHTWLGKCEGNKSPTYDAIGELVENPLKNVVVIPVYDDSCNGDPRTNPICHNHVPTDTYTIKEGGSDLNYHIIDYSVVRVTCVQQGNGNGANNQYSDPIIPLVNGECKGRAKLLELNPGKFNANSLETVEGYFVSDFDPRFTGACGPKDPDSGPYTVYLK